MRTREEINEVMEIVNNNRADLPELTNSQTSSLILEVLLDIRDLLTIKEK